MPRRYVLEDQVGHLLRRAHQRATQIFLETFDAAGLTPTQWAALARLGEEGAASQNHLGRLTAMDPATVQGVIQRLEKRGLIDREPDPDDRRRTRLKLSAEGAELVARHTADAAKVSALTLAPLTAEEAESFLALLKKLA
ncbi:transcriptional regulator [Thalassobaculum fulvum]|jgi:DNA-binding MarR family transcriptional regulator|uniref:Transcriptional regulator n=1 Tax=Thalassobaculum fulvum TaxID=1633335 RepID=A0A918XW27_9PROT|nr:MarR family transcriptional regulator [Thalassobaculum fulvum]GHD59412.1 transcriptional regulator [Thalassobaculum fulvum]